MSKAHDDLSTKQNSNAAPSVPHWHALTPAETLAHLHCDAEGLTETEAERRRTQYGPNRLRPPYRRGPLGRFLLQFHNVLIYVLIGAAVITAFLEHWIDAAVIIGVVIINAIIGFVQEGKAERALDAIRNMLSLRASVRRDGHRLVVPAEDLVPGDIVYLQSGDKVPADLRLLDVKSLEVEEAALTGESNPVAKATSAVDPAAALGDRTSVVYSGTLVTYGRGVGVVVGTGDATEIGRISTLLADVQTLTTPLLRQIAIFSRWLTLAIILLASLAFAFGILVQGFAADEMFLAAVAIAVAAIPEGLPAIMTITLAIGVQRMARRNAIIRRLPAVEALGAVTVICSDKTGTLTRNEMTVRSLVTRGATYAVSGVGYDPHGAFSVADSEVSPSTTAILQEIGLAALLCNDATVSEGESGWSVEGAPTEAALLVLSAKTGLDVGSEVKRLPRTDLIPFESAHRFMATLHHDHQGNGFVYVKGAPEAVLAMCDRQRHGDSDEPIEQDRWLAHIDELAGAAQRVLAIATRTAHPDERELSFEGVQKGLTLLGLFGLADPPRDEAIAAVAACQRAGLRVKMITGDHAVTASAIAAQLGIENAADAISGPELESRSDTDLADIAMDTDVFARSSPEHKLRLVQALQARGQVVAMTGDGVNDAPALKRADVGVAMGIKGTEAAKEAAEMVLADDNFASIAHAIEEGRTVYDNLRKAILFILPTNAGEAFTIVAAILLGRSLPLTAAQVLWVNMITAVTLALALAFEPTEPGTMQRPPRRPNTPLLSPMLLGRIAYVSLILVAGTFGLFVWERAQGTELAEARTVAVNVLVFFEIFYLFSSRYLLAPSYTREGIFGSRPVLLAVAAVLIFQVAFTYLPFMNHLFGTAAIDAAAWLRIVVVAASIFVAVEAEKLIRRHYFDATRTATW